MVRDDRLYAFIIAQTSRSRSRIRRVCVHKRWLRLSAFLGLALFLAAAYGLYGLTQHLKHGGAVEWNDIATGILAVTGFAVIILLLILLSSYIKKLSSQKSTSISQFTKAVISCLSPKGDAESILGDLQEEYGCVLKNSGLIKAKAWLYKQLVKSSVPLVYSRSKNVIFRLTKSMKRYLIP